MKRQKQNQRKSSRWRHAYFCFHLQDKTCQAQLNAARTCDVQTSADLPRPLEYLTTHWHQQLQVLEYTLVRHCSAACCARKRMHCFPILLFLPTCGRKRFSFALVSKKNIYISLKKCYWRGRKMLDSFNKWHVIWLHKTHKLLCYPRVTIL